ncbi:Zn-dependent oligopeptidase [Burkholderiales bacterium JOSHI_001]|nr:Zn-dependent oligopeptidase [Burkholderiales bacterium JOSHI_001]
MAIAMAMTNNPLLQAPTGPFGLPAFDQVRAEHFRAAFPQAMQQHRDELRGLADQAQAPDFDNTVAAFDRAGRSLARLEALFHNLAASATSPELQAVQREFAAPLAAHWSAVFLDEALFQRLDAVHRQRDALPLNPSQKRLLQRLHLEFVRSGAQLQGDARQQRAQLVQRLAELTTAFAQNVLHDEANQVLVLDGEADLQGLPDWLRAATAAAAQERGLAGHVVTLGRSLVVPFLSFSPRRDLRERAWRAWVGRGESPGPHDNRPVAAEILALRLQLARLHGQRCYADYALADTMAGTQARVWQLLDEVWQRSCTALQRERDLLRTAMAQAGVDETIEPWDWRYWAEQVRRQHFALDEAELKAYFPLPSMVQALFDCAQRLFGLRFTPRPDLPRYHPDVDVYEVQDAECRHVGLFLHDNLARPTKRSGAWMSALRWQHRNGEAATPIILNNNNFARGASEQPTLLSLEDVRTLFHEFGHGLHGLLSDVDFERQSGTQVLRDFVELPSQLFEHWTHEPQVLQGHARHWRSGAALPTDMLERMQAARRFGQAFETVRYTASAIVDMAVHASSEPVEDVVAFEQQVLAQRGLPAGVGLNHRLPHFQHLFAGSAYAAGYYVYLWAEVLDADAFSAFEDAGDAFQPDLAARLRRCIYASGDSLDPDQAFLAFRGRSPRLEPLLRKRGLMD